VLIPLCALCVIFARPLMKYVLVDFSDPRLTQMSIQLFRWFINYLLLISISAVLMGVLNSHYSFFIPAVTPILFSLAVIGSVLFFYPSIGIYSMALGVLAGGLLQILFQVPSYIKHGFDFRLDFSFRKNEDFKRIIRLWLPVVATASIFAINEQLAVRFATGLEEGSSSSLQYALVFFQLPFGIFSTSIITVLFPRMSRQAAAEDVQGLRESVQYGLRFLIIFLIPSTVIFCLLSREIISVTMHRGNFTLEDTLKTARVLVYYSIGLLSIGVFTFLQRFFYANNNFKVPFIAAFIVCVIDVSLSLWLKETFLRVLGLALANTVSFTLGSAFMLIMTRHRLKRMHGRRIGLTTLKVTAAMVPAAGFILVFLKITGAWWMSGSAMKNFLYLCVSGFGSVIIIFIIYYVLKVEMIYDILNKRLKKQ
ncbi:MAG: murein biosynthesis integral membrane protein MurJ, partial [Spirochaetales bacterium]